MAKKRNVHERRMARVRAAAKRERAIGKMLSDIGRAGRFVSQRLPFTPRLAVREIARRGPIRLRKSWKDINILSEYGNVYEQELWERLTDPARLEALPRSSSGQEIRFFGEEPRLTIDEAQARMDELLMDMVEERKQEITPRRQIIRGKIPKP